MLLLVVEDSAVDARVLVRVAENLGHECRVIRDAEEAYGWFASSPDVDLVVSSLRPRGLAGHELCRRVRNTAGRYRPFLFLTAADDPAEQRHAMEVGADDFLTKPLDAHGFQMRMIAMERLVILHRRLEAQAAELRRLNQRFYEDGITDALTGVGNRKRFDHDLAETHSKATSLGLGYSLGIVDVDWFKAYNDTLGHPAGDKVLKRVAAALQAGCRAADRVYRYGGEEFAVLLTTEDPEVAARVLERMRATVARADLAHPGSPLGHITISGGGLTVAGTSTRTAEEVVECADVALYEAKHGGRDRVNMWDPTMTRTA